MMLHIFKLKLVRFNKNINVPNLKIFCPIVQLLDLEVDSIKSLLYPLHKTQTL